MDHNTQEDRPNKVEKLFQIHQVVIASLFGTALAGILALALNYRALKNKKAYIATIISIPLILPVYIVTFLNVQSSPYDRFYPIFVAILIGFTGAGLQKKFIDDAMINGAERNTKWILFFLIVAGLIGSLSLLFFLQLVGAISLPS